MAGIADTAVGAILHIDDDLLTKIKSAENHIKSLGETSDRVAKEVSAHWGTIATSGLDTFIQRLADAHQMMKGMSGSKVDFNINTNQATEKVSSASKQIEKDLYAISKTVQQVAQDFDFSNPEASLKKWGNTFREIEAQIRNTAAVRTGMATDDPELNKYNRLIEVLKEYVAQKKKSKETVDAEQAKAEAKAIAAGDKLIAQREAQIAKQEAADQKAAQNYEKWWLSALANVEAEQLKTDAARNAQRTAQAEQDAQRRANAQATAEKEVNDILTKRIELQQKITALNTKQSISALSDPTANLGFSDFANLQKYERQMHTLEQRLREISVIYPKLARDSESAFNTQKADLLALSMQKIADEQAKIASGTSISKATDVEDRLNALYTERLRLLKEIEQLNNKDMLNKAKGLSGISAEENQLLGKLNDRLNIVNQNITTIGQNYVGLALKAKHAFELPELRQTIQLQNQLNDALKSVDASNAKQLTAEYKRLTAEAQKLAQSMREYTAAGGDKNSTAYQQLEAQFRNIMMQRRIIEMENVDEVNNYRLQRQTAAYQQDLSVWVQYEAQKTARAKEEYSKRAQSYREANQKAMETAKGALAFADTANTYRRRELAIKNLNAAISTLSKKDKDYEAVLASLHKKLRELTEEQSKTRKPAVSPQDAINAAKTATTLHQLEAAYKALKEAMANTDPTKQKWSDMNSQLQQTKKNIDEIKKKMGEFKEQAVRIAGVTDQLRNKIMAAFSIGAINGFIKKMVEVRAQFELQRVALGAIIQDRDEANKIFTQVQNMALESPFSIMQLERATKQIAAFGFEAKKLVPTMKMFADISAGLGVEIDRLVLVMGHLKARGFLEGMMTRQFTNMGFNVLGELSKYYSELENKMVSVGEVQDRVKKKMVSFADVEEVLKRVTSAGGMFYDMQKKQSDSIWGQMQRIKDAYDLMLNEIGQSNESSIKGALTLIRTLINHWRALAPIIKATGTAIIWYFAVSRWSGITAAIGGVVQAFKNMTTVIWGTKAAQDALNASQKANAWGLLAALIAAAVVAIYEYATAQSKLNESMDRVRNEGIGNMYDLIYQYQKLADTVRDTNKPYEEQKKALDEIKRIYADILPAEMLEIKNIKEMSDGYERATEAIKAYSAEKIKSNLKAEIENIVGKDIQDAGDSLAKKFVNMFHILPDKMSKDTLRSIAKTMIAEVSEEVKNGALTAEQAVDELNKRMVKRLRNIIPDSEAIINRFFEIISNWGDYESTLRKFENQIKGIDIGITDAESENLVEVKKKYENLTNAVDEYKKAIEALRLAKEEGQVKGDLSILDNGAFVMKTDKKQGYEALKNLYQAYENLKTQVERYGVTWNTTSKDINAAIESQTGQMNYFEQTNENVFVRVLSGFSRWQKRFRDDDSVKAWVEKTLREADKLDLSDVQNKILGVALSVTSANGMQVKSLDKLRLASLNSFGDAAKAAQSVYNQLAQNEIAIQTQINTLTRYGYTAAKAKTMAEEQYGAGLTVDEIKELMKLYKELIPAFGGTFKDPNKSKSKSDKELKRWQDLKKAIEDVSTAYDKYRKSFTVEESNKRIEELYGPVFKELNSDIKQFYKDGKYDAESMINALEVLKGLTNAATEERKKFRSEIERKIGVTQVEIEVKMSEDAEKKLKSDLDEMFANYELTEELKKIGVSVDLTYMVGGKPTTLADIRREIARLRAEGGGKADAENRIKILEEAEKKLTQIEEKNQRARLKNYIKYLTESMGERAQIEIKALQDVNKIREDETLDSFSKEQAIMQRRKKMYEDLSKMDLDSLKSSDVYISVFKDLERASKEQLQYVLNKLRELQSTFKDLSPAQVKSIASEMKKIEDALADKDSIKNLGNNLKDAIEYARQRNELLREQTRLQTLVGNSDKALQTAQAELYQLELKRNSIQDETSDEWRDANDALLKQQMYVAGLQAQIESLKRQLEEVTGKINKGSKAWTTFHKGMQNVAQYIDATKQALDDIFEGIRAAFNINDATRDAFESISEIMGGISKTANGLAEIDIMRPFTLITGLGKAIGGVFSTIGGFFGIGDKKKERQIKNLTEKVETLDKAYQRLEKSIEDAYRFDDYKAGYSQMQKTLAAEKSAYEEMLALEKAKKKSDNEKVKQYEDALEDIAEKQKELQKSLIEDFGSTTDYRSAAEDFVSAWLDAFKETGDGLDALNENWQEFIQNLFIKQAAMAKAGDVYKDVIDIINNAMTNGKTDFSLKEAIAQAQEAANKGNEYMNDYLKALAEVFNIRPDTSGELILSDLQKGIQNITEPQAAAIEAYLNSMRFAVFRHTEQLDTLIATIQMQYGGNAENPVVTELKGIRGVLDSIDRRLGSVINTQGRNATLRIGAN